MINLNYLRNSIREHRLMAGFTFVFLGLFQYLIIEILVSFNFLEIAAGFIRQLPVQIQRFLGEGFLAQFSLQGAMAFGYTHPLVLTILSLIAIQIPAKRIAGEIESGAMEYFLALPIRRVEMGFSLILFSIGILFLLVAGALSGTALGMLLYPTSRVVSFHKFIFIGLNLWILMICINSYAMMISTQFNESGRTAMLAAVITLILYFLDYFVRLSDSIAFLKPIALFSYYDPIKNISAINNIWINCIVLSLLSLVFYTIFLLKIRRRDIPG